jgi:hypothetical protein
MTAAILIGFRDRGTDPLRRANLDHVLKYWEPFGLPIHVVGDGGAGAEQFNRHRAYNRAAQHTDADILCYVESDMLLPYHQMEEAIQQARTPGLIVPFTERHEYGPDASTAIRAGADPRDHRATVVKPRPRRTGAINVLSRTTLDMVGGYDEHFTGCWFDDKSMHRAFDIAVAPTRWIDGPAYHLYHLPGYEGAHLTDADKAATQANKRRYIRYTRARTPDQIRALTSGQS